MTTSFFKNITAVGPLYSASHSVESELEDFQYCFYFWIVGVIRELWPTDSYLWTVKAYIGPLATASHSEAVSIAICSTVTTAYFRTVKSMTFVNLPIL